LVVRCWFWLLVLVVGPGCWSWLLASVGLVSVNPQSAIRNC
jgi:hypothetical protein